MIRWYASQLMPTACSLTLLILAAVPAYAASADAPAPADLVLVHGRIHTEDAARSVVQALAVRGNTIVAVGTDREVGAFAGPGTRSVDLAGRVVLPGIIDAHTHPAQSAQDIGKCSLDDKPVTPMEVKARVAACLRDDPRRPRPLVRGGHGGSLRLDADPGGSGRHACGQAPAAHGVGWPYGVGQFGGVETCAHRRRAPKILPAVTSNATGQREPTGTLRDTAAEIAQAAAPAASLEHEAAATRQGVGVDARRGNHLGAGRRHR